MSVVYLLSILDGRELSAPLLMLVDPMGLRVFIVSPPNANGIFIYHSSSSCATLPGYWKPEGFPLLSPGDDERRVGRVSCISPNGSPSPPTCLQCQQRELSWVLVPPISLLCTSSYWRPGKRAWKWVQTPFCLGLSSIINQSLAHNRIWIIH